MKREDFLLYFLGHPHRDGGVWVADPVRVMKGMFLLTMECSALRPDQKYEFKPYHYGPFSVQVYHDVDALVAQGLVKTQASAGHTWSSYVATGAGAGRAREIGTELRPEIKQDIERIRAEVAAPSFLGLLRDVYRRYPEYSVRSIIEK
jgi:hypothetical protein